MLHDASEVKALETALADVSDDEEQEEMDSTARRSLTVLTSSKADVSIVFAYVAVVCSLSLWYALSHARCRMLVARISSTP
jgi:hypothetical protein